MGLHIGELAIEQLPRPLDGKALGDIDKLAASVIASTGVTLGIFVGHHRALGLENRARNDIL